MQLRRFLTERTKLRVGSSVKLLEEEAYHIRKSLRLQPDDEIILFNGEKEYRARLKIVSKEVVMAEIKEVLTSPAVKAGKHITLAQGLIRAANFELILQKGTELGVSEFLPLFSEFSQIALPQVDSKLDRWQKIVIEACKQSERISIPQIDEPISFKELTDLKSQYGQVLLFTLPRPATVKIAPVKDLHELAGDIAQAKRIAYLVGPEGGFSPTEHKLAAEWGIPFVSLSGNVLKAETAAIAIQSVLNYLTY